MTNCVYYAYRDHLLYLGLEPSRADWFLYSTIKKLTQSPVDYTYNGIVPLMIECMARAKGLDMKVQHYLWTKEMCLAFAIDDNASMLMRLGIITGDFQEEVDKITLEPAIYLLYGQRHAIFSTCVPRKGIPVMAIQLSDKKEKELCHDRSKPKWSNRECGTWAGK